MPFGIGICPRCATQNSVFSGVGSPALRTQDEPAQAAPVRCEPAALFGPAGAAAGSFKRKRCCKLRRGEKQADRSDSRPVSPIPSPRLIC
jgi:hypothetical protein